MSFLSPIDAKKMVNHRKELQMHGAKTGGSAQSGRSMAALLALSKDLKTYSMKQRAIIDRLREDAARRRLAAA